MMGLTLGLVVLGGLGLGAVFKAFLPNLTVAGNCFAGFQRRFH